MRFTSYFPALDVLTTQLDSLSKPSRPQYVKNFCNIIAFFVPMFMAASSPQKLRGTGLSAVSPEKIGGCRFNPCRKNRN